MSHYSISAGPIDRAEMYGRDAARPTPELPMSWRLSGES
jgi:hypothetical protein